jgi:hypothetical protein
VVEAEVVIVVRVVKVVTVVRVAVGAVMMTVGVAVTNIDR